MELIHLPLEILINITDFLSTKDILNLSTCSERFQAILSFVNFNKKIKFKNINGLSYFDSFTNVEYDISGKPFPKYLRVLHWHCNDHLPSQLPNLLESLYLSDDYYHPLPQLPNSLKSLTLGYFYNQKLPELPASLKSLHLGYYYNKSLPQLPDSLECLHLGGNNEHQLPQLPGSLKSLQLGWDYNQPLPKLPDSLRHLKVRKKFPLPAFLPSNINVKFF